MYRLIDGIEFMRSLPAKSVDGIFTDPPWGARVSKNSTGHGRPDIKIRGQSNWLDLLRSMTEEGARVLKPEGRCLIWLGMRHVGPAIRSIDALEYKWMVLVRYIPSRYLAGLQSKFDPILYYSLFGAAWPKKIRRYNRPHEYVKASHGGKDSFHPFARPMKTVAAILYDWFSPGEYVIDPFAGSDTTGVACRELKINWDSCESDPKMYPTGIERHKQGHLFERNG